MNEIITIEKIGDYKREAKRFVKGLIKSKLFTSPENKITFTIIKGEFDKKAKQGVVTLCTVCPVSGMGATYTIMAPTRVYNKVDATLFDTLVAQLGRMKTPITLVIE
jgi:hypothetical protein